MVSVPEATILILQGAGLSIAFQQFLAKTFSRGSRRQKQVVFLIVTLHQTQNLHGGKSYANREEQRRQDSTEEKVNINN